MRYRALLLDMDGTLIDSSGGIVACAKEAMEELGIPIPPEDTFHRFIGPPLKECFRIVAGGEDEALLDRAVASYKAHFRDEHIAAGKLYPGWETLLPALKAQGVKLGVATLKFVGFARKTTDHFGLTPLFDAICGSVPEKTPSKEGIIREALAEMGIDEADADAVLMVGDSPYDEEGAAAVGCRFAAATYGFGYLGMEESQIEADVLVHSVEELADYLQNS